MPVLCPSCGTVGHDADQTCAACGTDLAGDPVALVPAELAAPAAHPSAPRRASSPRRRTVVVAVAAVLVAGTVAAFALARGPRGPTSEWAAVRIHLPAVPPPAQVRVVALGPRGELRLADLATGRVRELRRGGVALRATAVVARGDVVVFRTFDGRVRTLATVDGRTPHVRDLGRADALVASADPGRVWLARGSRLDQVGTDGRTFTRAAMPAGFRLTGGGLDDDALVLASTSGPTSIVVNPRTRRVVTGPRSSHVLAAASRTVVTFRCTTGTNTCRASALDTRTGSSRPLDAPAWDGFDAPVIVGRVSPDGRYAAFGEAFPGHDGVHASVTLVDTDSGAVTWTGEVAESASEPTAWDDRGDLLFFTDGVTAFVHHVDGPSGNVVSLGSARGLDPVAVLARRDR